MQSPPCLLHLCQARFALSQGLAVGGQALLGLPKLFGIGDQFFGFVGLLAGCRVDGLDPLIQLAFFSCQSFLSLSELGHRGIQGCPAFFELPAFLIAELLFAVELCTEPACFFQPLLQFDLRGIQPRLLFGETLLLAADFFAHPFQAGAQRGQHRLLPFQRRGPLGVLR